MQPCKICRKFLLVVFFILFTLPSHSSTDFPRLKEKGDAHLLTIGRVYEKYGVMEQKKTTYRLLEEKWLANIKQYERATPTERSAALRAVKATYYEILGTLKLTAEELQRYSDDLVKDYTNRIHDVDVKGLNKDEYSAYNKSKENFPVIQREFYRAHRAYLQKQYSYSVSLYDAGIAMMYNTYQLLKWPFPSREIKPGENPKVETDTQ